jgi:hypothetical protein
MSETIMLKNDIIVNVLILRLIISRCCSCRLNLLVKSLALQENKRLLCIGFNKGISL